MTGEINILCVEDEGLLLGDLIGELQDSGYGAVAARNGREALDILQTMKPDIILCDIMMPEMDGPALLKKIRSTMPALDQVPFIFLTARSAREDVIEGKKLGSDDYLTKPVDYDMLIATIESRIAGVRRMAEHSRQQLAKLYKAYKATQKEKPPIRVSIVASNTKAIAPISSALSEVGCTVTLISEDTLHANTFAEHSYDVTFLVYSKKVHYLLQYLENSAHKNKAAKMVVLVPPNMNANTKEALAELGVDGCIEFPFRPVEIFKVIMDKLSQRPGNGKKVMTSLA
ncbi:response regulator receiver domain-containing protein [Breoghania corrubedonensis]|uniref:Response regulator receiver domain-containing protein n=1 Tax=Breoghania corrubedonensis TaxID=665038 RepID=A0A2T5VCM2_9HYPH|nr:response regulator [Breoghania corrubedonensis]PTW61497.1 response regulator receiver domain-containing protein [Breoghania corrubedonensis]